MCDNSLIVPYFFADNKASLIVIGFPARRISFSINSRNVIISYLKIKSKRSNHTVRTIT